MSWHLNQDRPIYTRHPEPEGWGWRVTHTWQPFGFEEESRRGQMVYAVHEAGHAALFLRAGVPVVQMKFYSPQEVRRWKAKAVTISGERERPLGAHMTCLAAGERAADRWLHEEGLWNTERAWAVERYANHDRKDLEDVVREHLGKDFTYGLDPGGELDCASVHDWADAGLDAVWGGVMALAEELVARRSLDRAQVEAVFKSATRISS